MILVRPEHHLERLTFRFKWEVTRRHPVYLQLWQVYQTLPQVDPPVTWEEFRQEPDIVGAYDAIKIHAEPHDPSLSFEQLSREDGTSLFFRDALQPIKVKQILAVLAKWLPAESLRQVAADFQVIADGKDGVAEVSDALEAAASMAHSVDSVMEAMIDAPFYVVSPIAPREQMQADLVACQNHWRERLNLDATRDRAGDYINYLQAWDACEGFNEGRYHRDRVQSFAAASQILGEPAETIRRWYQRAFFLITGHEFSNENWHAAMGAQQISEFFGISVSPVSRARLRRSLPENNEAEVDFSTVQQDDDFLDTAEHRTESVDRHVVCSRICAMIDEGQEDSEIIDGVELEFGPQPELDEEAIIHAIVFLRERDDIRAGYRSAS